MLTDFQLDDLARQFPDVSRAQIRQIILAWSMLPTVEVVEVVPKLDEESDSEPITVNENQYLDESEDSNGNG